MKLTFNPENWVQDEITVTINKSKKTFRWSCVEGHIKKETIFVDGYGKVGYVFYDEKTNSYTAKDIDTGLERSDKNEIVASVKMLSNVI